jgi:hypothetical protein
MPLERRLAWTIQYCKTSILSSIFTTALKDQITYIHRSAVWTVSTSAA